MQSQSNIKPAMVRHHSPHLGALAIIYTVLFIGGLCAVTGFGYPFGIRPPYFPGPWESTNVIVSYLQTHHTEVLTCMFLQFGSMVPLGLFTASAFSRLSFLRVSAAGASIALFGGLLTVFDSIAATASLWATVHAGVPPEPSFMTGMYYLAFVFGGPGFSVPMGLLIAGICVPAAFMKLLPRWLVVFGLILALAGELSWLNLVFPQALFLVPLVRFPGFIWLIAAGFALPGSVNREQFQPAASQLA